MFWLLGVVLIVVGVVVLLQGSLLLGILLIVAGCVIAPGGSYYAGRNP